MKLFITLAGITAFALFILGGAALLNENLMGWVMEGAALLIAVPMIIFTNREEKANA